MFEESVLTNQEENTAVNRATVRHRARVRETLRAHIRDLHRVLELASEGGGGRHPRVGVTPHAPRLHHDPGRSLAAEILSGHSSGAEAEQGSHVWNENRH